MRSIAMDKTYFLLIVLLMALSPLIISGQERPATSIDNYLERAKTILIVKCLSVGPVNILLRANVEVEILYVVKGKETLRNITVVARYGMAAEERYLISTSGEATRDAVYFHTTTRDAVIPISESENLEELKALSPKIIVLRTMNLRVDRLESKIRVLGGELETLKAARREN